MERQLESEIKIESDFNTEPTRYMVCITARGPLKVHKEGDTRRFEIIVQKGPFKKRHRFSVRHHDIFRVFAVVVKKLKGLK